MVDDQQRQYEELARRAQERRRMLEARRLDLERRMREREGFSEPAEPVWWDDEEEPLEDELESPWIEEHEAPVQFQAPARRQEEPRRPPAASMERGQRAPERRRRWLAALESREGLRQAIIVREVLGPPVALRPFDEGQP